MRIPPLVLFTNLAVPGTPKGPISVRADVVVLVEHTLVSLTEKPAPGVTVRKTPPTGSPMTGTCIHIAGGGTLFVEESVEEVSARVDAVKRGGWFTRVFS